MSQKGAGDLKSEDGVALDMNKAFDSVTCDLTYGRMGSHRGVFWLRNFPLLALRLKKELLQSYMIRLSVTVYLSVSVTILAPF